MEWRLVWNMTKHVVLGVRELWGQELPFAMTPYGWGLHSPLFRRLMEHNQLNPPYLPAFLARPVKLARG